MEVELQYVTGCPNWRPADQTLRAALEAIGLPAFEIRYVEVTTSEQAEAIGFRGSPTVLIDGHDLFPIPGPGAGLSCRLYDTPGGLAGTPTLAQLIDALFPPP